MMDVKQIASLFREIADEIDPPAELEINEDDKRARAALSSVCGALVDSGVVVPAEEWRYGEAVREITKKRDAAVARLKIATDALEILALRQDHVGQVAAQALGELKGGS